MLSLILNLFDYSGETVAKLEKLKSLVLTWEVIMHKTI